MLRFFCFSILLCALAFCPTPANAGASEAEILDAAAKGDVAEVRRLVSETPSLVHARDSLQRTPLHLAAKAGDVETLRALIEADADLSARDQKLATPLHAAAWNGRREAAGFLLARGADVQAVDWCGRTPLAWALLAGRKEMVEFLRPRMSRPDIFSACALGERDAVKSWLREDPAIVRRADESGNTPLHWAVLGWQPKTVELLVSRGADLSARNVQGETPLMLAERMYENEAVAVMRRSLARRQKQAWAWAIGAIVLVAGIAGARFVAGRR